MINFQFFYELLLKNNTDFRVVAMLALVLALGWATFRLTSTN